MKYVVHTRQTIQHIRPRESHVIISISDTDREEVDLTTTDTCCGVLRLAFDDVDGDMDVGRPVVRFNETLAQRVLDLWERARAAGVAAIYVHCNAGQSRSPAIAAALTRLDGMDDDVWFKFRTPNRLVYRTLMELGLS